MVKEHHIEYFPLGKKRIRFLKRRWKKGNLPALLDYQNSNETVPQEINMDLIKELRLRGKHDEAKKLLEAHKNNLKQLKDEILKERERDYHKVGRYRKKFLEKKKS